MSDHGLSTESPCIETSLGPDRRTVYCWLTLLIAIGLLWRIGRYAIGFPLWGDEAFVACDVLDRDFGQLLRQPPEYFQVVPLLYRWILRVAVVGLGPSEYSLRLFSLLAGCGALLLFARVAWKTLPATAATLATGIFAAGYPLVRHAAEVKPYAADAFVSVALLWAALRWIRCPEDWSRPILLTSLAVVAIWLSFPAILIAAALGLGLLICIRGRPRWWLALYTVAVAASFLAYLSSYAQIQMTRSAGSWLESYWAAGFPVFDPPQAALFWLLRAHLSEMMGYPVGGTNFGSIANGLLFGLGVFALWKAGNRRLTLLLTLPFAAGIAAAAVHRYPYGTAARLAQYLAPFICLFMGCGIAFLIERIRAGARRRKAAAGCVVVLVLFMLIGLARDVIKPFKAPEDAAVRSFVQAMRSELPPGSALIIANPREAADQPDAAPQFLPTARYYLLTAGYRLAWIDDRQAPADAAGIMVTHGRGQPPSRADVERVAQEAGLVIGPAHESEYLPIVRKTLSFYVVEPGR